MSSSVDPVGTTPGQPVQLALDSGAVILLLVDKADPDLKAPPPGAAQPANSGQGFDTYA
jgi:hypothetical protein